MATGNDKPKSISQLLGKFEERASASAAAWRQHLEKHARRGESREDAATG